MFEEICKFFGNQKKLADVLEVTEAAISIWKRQGIPAARAIQIEELSGGIFKATEIMNENI